MTQKPIVKMYSDFKSPYDISLLSLEWNSPTNTMLILNGDHFSYASKAKGKEAFILNGK